jgi:uncharacterized membrane protein
LIPFPVYDIFTKEIFNYDVVVFENFSYRYFFTPDLLTHVKDYVEKSGGAFVMLGGPDSFGGGGYKGTAIEDILPVEIEDEQNEQFLKEPFRMKPEGHPVNLLTENKQENEKIWANLPELKGLNRFVRAKPGAVVLGADPALKDSTGNELPVSAAWQKGRGRVLAMGATNTWRWSMWLAGTGRGNYHYSRYWQQIFNWLVNTPDLKQVLVSSDKKVYKQGDDIKVDVTVFDEYYQYEDKASVSVTVIDPENKSKTIGELTYSGNGVYELLVSAEKPGRYLFTASAFKGNKSLGTTTNYAEVNSNSTEYSELFLNEKVMKDIALVSGGTYYNSDNMNGFGSTLKSSVETISSSSKMTIWDSPFIFVIIIILLIIEWYLRRISGLL